MTQDEFERFVKNVILNPPSGMVRFGLSPTSVESRGMYGYQEPEVDEQGTFYGYKILHKHCIVPGCNILISPRYPAEWINGELEANEVPSEHFMCGIHCTKRWNHPELGKYTSYDSDRWVLVRCALSGTIVETEQGFRAEHATIAGVCENGNWQSYQDYQERAQANYHYLAEKEGYWYTQGDWIAP